jgi:hypothetical protein
MPDDRGAGSAFQSRIEILGLYAAALSNAAHGRAGVGLNDEAWRRIALIAHDDALREVMPSPATESTLEYHLICQLLLKHWSRRRFSFND